MQQTIRPTLLASLLALAAVAADGTPPAAAAPTGSPERPNLILASSDDHRWDGLGAAGNPTIQNPHLDRLASLGICYRQATVNVSQYLPVRGSLLTGLAAHSHGAYSHYYRSPEAARPEAFAKLPTLPSLLAAAGARRFWSASGISTPIPGGSASSAPAPGSREGVPSSSTRSSRAARAGSPWPCAATRRRSSSTKRSSS